MKSRLTQSQYAVNKRCAIHSVSISAAGTYSTGMDTCNSLSVAVGRVDQNAPRTTSQQTRDVRGSGYLVENAVCWRTKLNFGREGNQTNEVVYQKCRQKWHVTSHTLHSDSRESNSRKDEFSVDCRKHLRTMLTCERFICSFQTQPTATGKVRSLTVRAYSNRTV